MSKKAETLFKERVLSDLKDLTRTWAVKIQQVAKRGTPDILACVAGHFVALELKSGVKPARRFRVSVTLQEWVLEQITAAGGVALKVYPEEWPNILSSLKSLTGETSRFKGVRN